MDEAEARPRDRSLSEHALAIIEADSLAGKLAPFPAGAPDQPRGPARQVTAPTRPHELRVQPARAGRVRRSAACMTASSRAHPHARPNHRLQAVERSPGRCSPSPGAPTRFRLGLPILRGAAPHAALHGPAWPRSATVWATGR